MSLMLGTARKPGGSHWQAARTALALTRSFDPVFGCLPSWRVATSTLRFILRLFTLHALARRRAISAHHPKGVRKASPGHDLDPDGAQSEQVY